MKPAKTQVQSAFNLKSNLQLAVGLGVLLLLAFALFYKSPTSAKSRSLLAQAQVLTEMRNKQKVAKALPLLNEAAGLTPQKVDVYIYRGWAYELLEEYEKAAADYSQAIALKPANTWTHAHYARVLLATGEVKLALEQAKRAVSIDPQNEDAYHYQGIAYQRLKMVPQALQAFDQALAITPDAARIYLSRAQMFVEQKDNQRALDDCSAAIAHSSGTDAANAYITRGNILQNEKKFQKALANYDVALKIDPQNSFGFLNRGVVYLKLETYPLALKDLNQATAISPEYWIAFYNRGYAYMQLQKYSLAFADFNRAIALNPKDAPSYGYRAQIFMRRKEWKKAIDDYTKNLSFGQNDENSLLGRGWANLRLSDGKAAERDFSLLIQRKKYLASAYSFRGLARLLQFRDAQARTDFAVSRRLNKTEDPKNADGKWKNLQGYIAEIKAQRLKNKMKP